MRTRSARFFPVFTIVVLLLLSLAPAFAEQGDIQETVLPNGLKVITREVHAAPVVSFMVFYKVGSRNEELGKTGLSHLLEHMMFKGTKTLKKGEIDKLIRENGGIGNAATWIDMTFYYETLSSDKLDLAMRIESDRMVNSLMEEKELKAEMTVVRSELEGNENDPDTLVYQELISTAFKSHPYQWPIIGWRNDVEKVSRDAMYDYYKTYYKPNNAIVVIVGDFDTEKALAGVRKYFGKIRKGSEPPKVRAVESAQFGERRSEVRKPGTAARVMMGHHMPGIGHADIYALDVLEAILSNGESSRLYKALVDKQLATDAWAGGTTSTDPNLFMLGGTARDGVNIQDIEAALLAEVERVKTELVSDEEMKKALNQLEAQFVFNKDSVTSQARMLGWYETMQSWRYLEAYLDNVRKVTRDDVKRVAETYLAKNNRTVVTFIPEQRAPQQTSSLPKMTTARPWQRVAAYRSEGARGRTDEWGNGGMGEWGNSASRSAAGNSTLREVRPTRVVLDNGLVVIVQENRSNPTVAVQGSLKAGGMFVPKEKFGLAGMTADMLLKGTSKRTAEQISAATDFVGMSLGTSADVESAGFSGRSLSKDFDLMLELLSDSLRNPAFPADELENFRRLRIAGMKQMEDNPEAMASLAFDNAAFVEGHPYHQPMLDQQLASISSLTRDDVVNFYRNYYGPQTTMLAIVGDVDTNEAIEKIKKYFGDWKSEATAKPVVIPDAPLPSGITKKVIAMPDKSQVDIFLGYPSGLKRSDPDFYAANVMNFVLGGGGALGSRLGDVIRDDMGLAYNVYSWFDATLGAGPWYGVVGTNPANADKAIEALVAQMKLMKENGATEKELKEAVDYIAGSFPVRLETNRQLAGTLHSAEFYGLGMDYVQNYQKIYRSVTLDQVNAAAQKYLHPDNYVLTIAGPYEAK